MATPNNLLFSTVAIGIQWHPEAQIMELIWRHFVSGRKLRTAFGQMLTLSEQHGARRWLTDYTALTAMRMADQSWLAEEYTPEVVQRLQLERSAIVQPLHPLGIWFLESMTARLAPIRPWPVEGFSERSAAWNWLVGHPGEGASATSE